MMSRARATHSWAGRFAALFPEESSPTRVAAQVVSGIGFLGAGVIFREGLNVRGLNTAATLWCSAAVGVLAGAGYAGHAAIVTAFVVFVNLLLRPVVKFINRQPLASTELEIGYIVSITCRGPDEAHLRALLLQSLAATGLDGLVDRYWRVAVSPWRKIGSTPRSLLFDTLEQHWAAAGIAFDRDFSGTSDASVGRVLFAISFANKQIGGGHGGLSH
jgi:hypothetical protein